MKTNFTQAEFSAATSMHLLPCFCYQCNDIFYVMKKNITHELKHNRGRNKFCCFKCSRLFLTTKEIVKCKQCGNSFEKLPNQIKKSKNDFCSRSCNVIYSNSHKTTGNRRSKLEKYIEAELLQLYPNLEILFNNKETINSELDIYIPSLKLAIELNGIFHYEPIYGGDKLLQITNNDTRKFQACLENGIELCIIDVSGQTYFNKKSSERYLIIIANIVDQKLLNFS